MSWPVNKPASAIKPKTLAPIMHELRPSSLLQAATSTTAPLFNVCLQLGRQAQEGGLDQGQQEQLQQGQEASLVATSCIFLNMCRKEKMIISKL